VQNCFKGTKSEQCAHTIPCVTVKAVSHSSNNTVNLMTSFSFIHAMQPLTHVADITNTL